MMWDSYVGETMMDELGWVGTGVQDLGWKSIDVIGVG